ncbi:hypothetical protein O1M63_25640 [Streptomyces mirabilis]|nr:hypothetical protein [Streptomyces mirabilis]
MREQEEYGELVQQAGDGDGHAVRPPAPAPRRARTRSSVAAVAPAATRAYERPSWAKCPVRG